MTPYRGRFAPTPSGPLHFGSIVAALGSYLQARRANGLWFLRIDDLDPLRVVPGAIDLILRTLETFCFEWDGQVIYQSRRSDAYHAALHRLRNRGRVYACSCSRKQIAETRREAAHTGIYSGLCRSGLGSAPARALRADTRGAHVEIEDGVLGGRRFDIEREFGDFLLYRADRVYAFHLASAVDEITMGISEVVRGRDLLESSARQHWLIEQLESPPPRYAHLPLALNEQGGKLSKQALAAPVDSRRPGAVLRCALSFLGQPVPEHLEQLDDVWCWAMANWRIEHVPRVAGMRLSTLA